MADVYDVNVGRAPRRDERVQHCNQRTDYEMVDHTYRPDECDECASIARLAAAIFPAGGLRTPAACPFSLSPIPTDSGR